MVLATPVETSTYRKIREQNAYTTLQSLLAFSLWEFSINNNGNVNLTLQGMQQYLSQPAEFQTKATISHEYTRFVMNYSTFIAYLVLQSMILAFCWSITLWYCASKTPAISAYTTRRSTTLASCRSDLPRSLINCSSLFIQNRMTQSYDVVSQLRMLWPFVTTRLTKISPSAHRGFNRLSSDQRSVQLIKLSHKTTHSLWLAMKRTMRPTLDKS